MKLTVTVDAYEKISLGRLESRTTLNRLSRTINYPMKTQTEELYDVVIYKKATRKIESIIGTDMKSWDGNGCGRNTAELRVQTGQKHINDRYECEMVQAGKYHKGDVLP